jgi:hypothetical protein
VVANQISDGEEINGEEVTIIGGEIRTVVVPVRNGHSAILQMNQKS